MQKKYFHISHEYIHIHLNGDIKINLKEHYLNYAILPERPLKEIEIKLPALTIRKQSGWKPTIDHPWKNQFTPKKSRKKHSFS